MNIIDFEYRICKKEEDLKQEIHNLKESVFLYDKKYQLSDILMIRVQIIVFLIYFTTIYFVFLRGIEIGLGFFYSYALFVTYFIYLFMSSRYILNIVYKKIYKGISKEKYWDKKYSIIKLEKNILNFDKNKSTFYKLKNRYNQLLLIKEKLFKADANFINDKTEWESKIDIRLKEFKETTFYTFSDFSDYEFLKNEYYRQIELNLRNFYHKIDTEKDQIISLFLNIEKNLVSDQPINFNPELMNSTVHQFRIKTFEEFLMNRTKNTEIKVKEKRVRVSGLGKQKIDKGYIKPLPSKENLDIEVNKFDTRQHVKNINLGLNGELFVLKYEKEKLINQGKLKLAKKVQHVSKLFGDKHGYDVLSYDFNGKSKWIEVKTTTGKVSDDFYFSENEYNTMINSNRYFIYRVYDFNIEENTGQIKEIQCSKEIDQLKFDVSMFTIKPNKLLNKSNKLYNMNKV